MWLFKIEQDQDIVNTFLPTRGLRGHISKISKIVKSYKEPKVDKYKVLQANVKLV